MRVVTIAMALLNLTGFVLVEQSSGFWIAFTWGVILVSYVVLWFFWQGRNWARWLVLITSVIGLLNLPFLAEMRLVQQVVVVAEAILGAFLLYWLNTASVKAFFRSTDPLCPPSPRPSPR
jgi:hypothetical protein